MAQHDALTNLPNRTLFQDQVHQAIVTAGRNGTRIGVLFLDLDKFKQINDSLGHAFGDKVLQSVVKRLLGCVRASDTVCRLGGDEFVILLSEIKEAGHAGLKAGQILTAINAPFEIDSHKLHITASMEWLPIRTTVRTRESDQEGRPGDVSGQRAGPQQLSFPDRCGKLAGAIHDREWKADLVSVCGFGGRDIHSQREPESGPLVGNQILAHPERLHTHQGLFDGLGRFYPAMLPALHNSENVYWGNHAETYSRHLRSGLSAFGQ
jgi:diguanylate cyclase (GGDEF)-like protein